MRVVADWKTVATKAWSVRFAVASALLTGFDLALPYLLPEHPSRALAVAAGFAAAASAGARLILQFNLHEDEHGFATTQAADDPEPEARDGERDCCCNRGAG